MTGIIRNTARMLLLALLTVIMAVEWANDSTIVTVAGANVGSARGVPAAFTVVEGKRWPIDRLMEAGTHEAQSVSGMGVLVGRVIVGPLSPVVRSGESGAPVGVPGARIVISRIGGEETTALVTDDHGGFRVPLPPGSYRIDMPPLTGGRFTKDVPATVTITEGQGTRLDIRIDTGIR
jgi:hypothetical protein